jgi:hypothetical protein
MFSKPSLIANNPLGIVIQSVERPSGDTTVYTYTPAGKLESEVREVQVRYSRFYKYNLDGSRAMVMRDDALNGSHWDVYSYDEVSGRLASVQDVWTGEVNSFAWNPEGTLARWEDPSVSYARVFGYDEEGRLVRIERDYGNGDVQLAYEYGYNSDGVRVWKRDVLAGQEYRYVCRIGCGGVPMRVYNRAMSGGSWNTLEEYVETPTVRWGGTAAGSFSDYPLMAGRWLNLLVLQDGEMLYHDMWQIPIAGGTTFGFDEEYLDVPEMYMLDVNLYSPIENFFTDYRFAYLYAVDSSRTWVITVVCLLACAGAATSIGLAWDRCRQTPLDQGGCKGLSGPGWWQCMINCAATTGCSGYVSIVLCVGCLLCICAMAKVRPICNKVIDQLKKIKKLWTTFKLYQWRWAC